MLGYIFGIDCQITLQVQEKLISRLAVEIYVQMLNWSVRILGKSLVNAIAFVFQSKRKFIIVDWDYTVLILLTICLLSTVLFLPTPLGVTREAQHSETR